VWPPWALGSFLAVAVILVYSNSFHGPFQYDDFVDIRDNVTIRHLWPLIGVFRFPQGGFITRPVANLTFALNYATGGLNPFHYHLTNLAIHIGASLAFLGVLRRTLSLPRFQARFSGQIPALSLVTAALWALHPLLTESVSYITQRYESLMGLFVLLTFYAVVRMATAPSPVRWALLASAYCLLALGSKEVAVSVPILVLLFDRTFLAGTFRGAWRERRVLYLGLLLAWTCFAYIQMGAAHRTFAGYGLTTPWWKYALNQPRVILHYLRLVIWPHSLNFDYYWPLAKTWGQLVPSIMAIGGLLGLSLWALVRRPIPAFLAIFFFFILAPTSSVMPILDLAVEHRMYLPSVPVVVFLVFAVHRLIHHLMAKQWLNSSSVRLTAVVLFACTLASLGALTFLRNEDYQNSIDLWRDCVEKSPNNPRAHHNYAYNLSEEGYNDEALRQFAIACDLAPGMPIFHTNYGVLLGRVGRYPEALEQLRQAVKLEPDNYRNIYNLAVGLWQKGSLDSAIICFKAAIQVNPLAGAPYSGLAALLLIRDQTSKAHELIQMAVKLEPYNPMFPFQLGTILLKLGDQPGAQAAFQSAIHLDGNPERMLSDVGWAFHERGQDREAIAYLRQALILQPGHAKSQLRLAWILAASWDDSVRNGSESLLLAKNLLITQPSQPPNLLDLLAVSLAETGQFPAAQAAIDLALTKSKDRKEPWVPDMERRLALFSKGIPYREAPKDKKSPTQQEKHVANS
jgi:Flp pilus assembly protein TadD